jgi:hypothetical protein
VSQHTPAAETLLVPPYVTLAPERADDAVMPVTVTVLTVGIGSCGSGSLSFLWQAVITINAVKKGSINL